MAVVPRAYGYKHFYLYDLQGNLIRQLTSGEWPMSQVSRVDEKGGWVYFEGWIESPFQRPLIKQGGDLSLTVGGFIWRAPPQEFLTVRQVIARMDGWRKG